MPRPNPPRKRPRRRPPTNRQAARADAALTKQTAESAPQLERPGPGKSLATAKAAAAQPPAPDELWSRRSYSVLLGVMAVTQVFIGILLWILSSGAKDLLGLLYTILGLNLISVLAAALLSAPIAKRLTGEVRSLRVLETLGVGMVLYFIYIVLSFVAGAALTAFIPAAPSGSNCGPSPLASPVGGGTATPRPSGTPCPSPSPSAAVTTPTPTASSGTSPSPSPGVATTGGTSASVPVIFTTIALIDVAAFVSTVYLYPPVYKRLRVRPPPRTPPGKNGKDSKPEKESR